MNINLTLLGEMLTFLVLVGVTMKYIWPPLMQALDERQAQITKGLKAAEDGHRALEQAKEEAAGILSEAKQLAKRVFEQAERDASRLADKSREQAQAQGLQMIETARLAIQHETQQAKEALTTEVGGLVIDLVQKLLGEQLDEGMHAKLVAQLSETDVKDLLGDPS